jgi:hypothetical protein
MASRSRPTVTISIAERRARLARRHRLTPSSRAEGPVEAAESLLALHGTDPGTVYLSAWARVDGLTVDAMDDALYAERSLVKHLSMRRTLWVFPRSVLPAAQAGASAKVAAGERKRLIAEVEKAGLQRDGAKWLDRACREVLAALADGRERTSTQLREEVPLLEGAMTFGAGKSWGGQVSVGPRVLTVLSAEGQIVRASNNGSWAVSRPRWTTMESWLGEPLGGADGVPAFEVGTTELVRRWLHAFGPGTDNDIRWWLGSTLGAVRTALVELEAVEVGLEGSDAIGYLLPDDASSDGVDAEPWVALLPPLDPTTMGWQERSWYLGDLKAELFDTAGNAGPTVWVDGRIVGGWRQRDDASVEVQLLEKVPKVRMKAITERADALTEWFAGVKAMPRFPSPLSKRLG